MRVFWGCGKRHLCGFALAAVLLASVAWAEPPAEEPMSRLDRAKRSYQAGEYGKVITELEAALVHPSNYSQEELATIYLYLGLAYLAFDRRDRAHQAFEESLRLDTELEMDPTLRSPEVEEAFERARWIVEQESAVEPPVPFQPLPLGQAIESAVGPTGKTRWGGVWRSCLVPGWGQIYGDRKKRGYAMLGCEVAALGGSLYATVKRDRAHDDYRAALSGSSVERINTLYDDYSSWRRTRDTLLIAAGGVWVINILESFLNDPSVPRGEDRAMRDWRFGGATSGPEGWWVQVGKTW